MYVLMDEHMCIYVCIFVHVEVINQLQILSSVILQCVIKQSPSPLSFPRPSGLIDSDD